MHKLGTCNKHFKQLIKQLVVLLEIKKIMELFYF